MNSSLATEGSRKTWGKSREPAHGHVCTLQHAWEDACVKACVISARRRRGSRAPSWGPDSPFSLCWKEGENSLAVILAIRASSWAFWAAARAASALAREWDVLVRNRCEPLGAAGTAEPGHRATRPPCLSHSADCAPNSWQACPRASRSGWASVWRTCVPGEPQGVLKAFLLCPDHIRGRDPVPHG